MRYIIALLIAQCIYCASAFAQTEQGRTAIGATSSISASGGASSWNREYSGQLSPTFSYFLDDGFAVTPGLSLLYTGRENSSTVSACGTIGLDYYFGHSDLLPFVSADIGIYYTLSQPGSTVGSDLPWLAEVAFGVTSIVDKTVGISGGLRLGVYHKYDDGQSIGDHAMVQLMLGARYFIPK